VCRVIAISLKKKTRKETNLKFYKIMAVPVLLHGSKTWTLRKRDWNRIQAAEMKYLRTVKGYTRLDKIKNEYIRNELGISPLSEKIIIAAETSSSEAGSLPEMSLSLVDSIFVILCKVLYHVVKSYDMGSPALIPLRMKA
jgi:hypothetical protein